MRFFSLTVLLTLYLILPVLAQGDARTGEKIYQKCRSCHELDHLTNKMGPHLKDLLGRTVGSVAGFQYSDALIQAKQDGLIWDAKSLKQFLTSPKTMFPGTKMRFWGLWENQIDDLTAYLQDKDS